MALHPRFSLLLVIALSGCVGRIGDARGFGDTAEAHVGNGAAGIAAQGGGRGAAGMGAAGMGVAAGGGGVGAAIATGPSTSTMTMGAAGAAGVAGVDNTGNGPTTSDNRNTPPPTMSSTRLYGVTVDAIDSLDDIVQSLQMLSRRPTTRVVFDEGESASQYTRAVASIYAVSGVMGEILDSYYVKNSAPADYSSRVTEYLDTLGDNVDIWEIGNEVNGEWLGSSTDVQAKITNAFRAVHARGKTTALTLYYNQGCFSSADHEMFRWAQAYVDDELKNGLDYVLISYYEDDCNGLQPDWPSVFAKLAQMFPKSKLGFGEIGTKDASKKAEYIKRYYGLQIALPQYIGGYFWWYFYQDMLPYTSQLWSVLNQTLEKGP